MTKPGEASDDDVDGGGADRTKSRKKRRASASASASASSSSPSEDALATSDSVGGPGKVKTGSKKKPPSGDEGAAPRKAPADEKKPASDDAAPGPSPLTKKRRATGLTSDAELDAEGRKKSVKAPPATPAPPPAATPSQVDPAILAQDALVGLMAVRDELASEQDVEKALATQRRTVDEGKPRPALLDLLVEQGALSHQRAAELTQRLDPEVIPGYRILAEVGRGGMGTVYKAVQISMQRTIALKVLAKRLSRDERYIEKFLYEARAAGKLNHEHIVQAIDCGAAGKIHYFAMEFVDGLPTNETLKKEGPYPWERAFQIAEQVARALDHAHKHGLVHRDVKPENIIIGKDGRAKLCDLGLAKEAQEAGTGEKSKTTEGTPYYCSPEQALGRTDIDPRSDVYSLGATLYHLLRNEPPFDGESPRQILWKQVHKPFPDLATSVPAVPPPLRALLAKMVEKERDARLASMQAFLDGLAAARQELAEAAAPPVSHGRAAGPGAGRGLAAVGMFVLFLLVGVFGALAVIHSGEKPPEPTPPAVPAPPQLPDPRPRVTRIDEPEVPQPPPSPPPSNGTEDGEAKQAQLLLDRAFSHKEKAPEDVSGFTAKLREVIDRYPGTPAASLADKELATLKESKVLDQDFAKLKKSSRELAAAGQYLEALDAIDAYTEKTDARLLAERKPEIEKWREDILEAARARARAELGNVQARLDKGEPAEEVAAALEQTARILPKGVGDELVTRAGEVRERSEKDKVKKAFQDVVAKREAALDRGDLAEAGRVVEAAAGDARFGATVKEELERLVNEQRELERTSRTFDESVPRLASEEKHLWKKRDGSSVEGQLKSYDPAAWSVVVKPFGRRDTATLELRDLAAEELLRFALSSDAPPAAHLVSAALYFMLVRAEPEAATLALDRWKAATGQDDAALREKLAKLKGGVNERRAAQLIARALASDADPQEVVDLIQQLAGSYAGTRTYVEAIGELRRAYATARAMRLSVTDLTQMFRGKISKKGKDLTRIEYDFADPAQIKDFVPDEAAVKGSTVKHVKGRLHVRGKALHAAVWEGGEVQVDMKVQPLNPARPNVNITLSDKTGWQALLVGLNFVYGGLSQVKVDPKALKKPGWPVKLPANVLIDLNGKEPAEDGINLIAEEKPRLPDNRVVRVIFARTNKGAISASFAGQAAVSFPGNSPRWDEAGAVGLAPFTTELSIESLEITGRLEQTSLVNKARVQAEAEANALPGPKGK